MRIERFDPAADTGKVRDCYRLFRACWEVDDPVVPPMSLPVFSGWLSLGWMNCPREAWLASDNGDSYVGAYLLELPAKENTHLGWLALFVDPARRRVGLGTALLRHAAQRAGEAGRAQLTADSREDGAGTAFARAVGARPGITEVRRVLDVAAIPDGHLDALRRRAEAAAAGYSLVSWQGACPEEYLEQVANVSNAMADAPHSPGKEQPVDDADRIREHDKRTAVRGLREYTVAARHDVTGELAALTAIAVDPERPDWGHQHLTAVTRPHRGHRLGLLVKVVMMQSLAQAEPELKHVVTGNADSNSHMIAINAELGYRVADRWPGWLLDVAQAASLGAQS